MVSGSVIHRQYDPRFTGHSVNKYLGTIKSDEKFLHHTNESSNGYDMEKYPFNTLYRACFFGSEDLSYKMDRNKPGIKVTQCSLVYKKEGNI